MEVFEFLRKKKHNQVLALYVSCLALGLPGPARCPADLFEIFEKFENADDLSFYTRGSALG